MLLTGWTVASLGLLAAARSVSADDHLISSRFSRFGRRGVDAAAGYNITFLHVNDIHAHLDQYRSSGTDCTDLDSGEHCLAGYARIYSKVRSVRSSVDNSLLLDAGDEFQGTLFYSYYGGEKIAQVMNMMNFTAFTLGNHEFDAGSTVLAKFLANLTAPVISSNIHTTHKLLSYQLQPYLIVPEHNLAIVSASTTNTPSISNPGPLVSFEDPITAIQRTIDHVKTFKGVKRVIALTHIGYSEDQHLAAGTRGLHLIVGGHSHTPLGDFPYSEGKYPTIVKNLDGEEVFVVTSYRWGEHLGRIDITFDADSGMVQAYTGAPIEMTDANPQDQHLQELITEWKQPFLGYASEVVGTTLNDLTQKNCGTGECNLGNLLADAMVYYRLQSSRRTVDGAIHNSGGVRSSMPRGNITRGEVVTAFPFGNEVVDVEFSGRDLWAIVEGVVSKVNQFTGHEVTSSIQISKEIQYSYNPKNPVGSRLISLTVKGEDVVLDGMYQILTADFIARGGDSIFPPYTKAIIPLGLQEDILTDYIKKFSPLNVSIEGRIRKTDSTEPKEGYSKEERMPQPKSWSNWAWELVVDADWWMKTLY